MHIYLVFVIDHFSSLQHFQNVPFHTGTAPVVARVLIRFRETNFSDDWKSSRLTNTLCHNIQSSCFLNQSRATFLNIDKYPPQEGALLSALEFLFINCCSRAQDTGHHSASGKHVFDQKNVFRMEQSYKTSCSLRKPSTEAIYKHLQGCLNANKLLICHFVGNLFMVIWSLNHTQVYFFGQNLVPCSGLKFVMFFCSLLEKRENRKIDKRLPYVR